MANMGRRRRRSACPVALWLLLFFLCEVESFRTKNAAFMQETSEHSLLKAQKPQGGVRGGGSSGSGEHAGGGGSSGNGGGDRNENGGTPGSSSSSPYGKVIPVVGGVTAAAAARNNHHKGNAYCFSCNDHFPVVFSITMLSAVVLVRDLM